MRALLLLSLFAAATGLFLGGCTNKYGDDPSVHGLPTPASTPVPTATPLPEKE
jgi:hypothetical protein